MIIEKKIHFRRGTRSRKEIKAGVPKAVPKGRIPRISKLMALAIMFDRLLQSGEVESYAQLARLGHVSCTRITQLMSLLQLAPDVQEALLFLPKVMQGRDPVTERDVRPVAELLDWEEQRRLWSELKAKLFPNSQLK